jgi:hypothetical protein
VPTTVRPPERAQSAIPDKRHHAGDRNWDSNDGEQKQVADELRARLVAAARRRVEEEVHARPAVPRLPDKVRNQQDEGDRNSYRQARRREGVAPPDEERRDQKHENDGERVLRLQPDPHRQTKQRPRAPSKRESQRQQEHDHGRQLVERDRLEEPVRREHPRAERDQDCGQRLRAPRRAKLARDENTDEHRPGTREDRERAKPDQRPAEQHPRERRQQRRHRRKLDVAALQMPTRDRVVELVAMPAVPPRDREGQRALERDHEEHRAQRQDAPLVAPAREDARVVRRHSGVSLPSAITA